MHEDSKFGKKKLRKFPFRCLHSAEMVVLLFSYKADEIFLSVLRAVDDSFGIHLFDIRAGSKKKSRVNPIMENHQVVCSACSDHYIALGSSTFVLENEDKKKSK
ncbi:hypothetical protein ANCCAN_29993, partial [Ancylostoma caninum]